MNWPEFKEHTAQRYAAMAQEPGCFQYVRHQVITLEAEPGGHWAGLRARWGAILLAANFRPSAAERVEFAPEEIEATRLALLSAPPILGRLV